MKKLALTILTAISLLVILSMQPMAIAYESIDSLVPPDYKYNCYDNFDGSLEAGRWTQDGYPLTFYWLVSPYDKWAEIHPYQTFTSYYTGQSWLHQWRDHVAMTIKMRSYHGISGVTSHGDWAIVLKQDRVVGGYLRGYVFGFLTYPATPNNKMYIFVYDGTSYWLPSPFTIGPGAKYWFYYRLILGYKYYSGAWRSWAWWFLGETETGVWYCIGECDLTLILGFGTRYSGSGVCDYPVQPRFGWHNYDGGLYTNPAIDLDFIASEYGNQNPFP